VPRTRIIRIELDDKRKDVANSRTVIWTCDRPAPLEAAQIFARRYDDIRESLHRLRRPGVVIVGASASGRLAGSVCISAKPDTITTAIIGRHAQADFFLPDDPEVSLRHLAVIVHPARAGLRYAVLDLRTGRGFRDERDVRRDALVADGSVVFRCASATFFVLAGGRGERWPDDARAAWAALPPRQYLDEPPRARLAVVEDEPSLPRITRVTGVHGPAALQKRLVQEGEIPLGELQITCGAVAQAILLGRAAAREGVLVGRYERCDGALQLDDDRVSRVHLLVIEIEGQLYAVDTASSNGVLVGEEARREVRLDYGTRLSLGGETTVEWRAHN
jgi:hypothetical protein